MSRISIICGPMFSGKSAEFIKKVNGLRAAGLKVSVFKPEVDTRDAKVTSRDGSTLEYEIIPNPKDGDFTYPQNIAQLLSKDKPDWIAIDEAQFANSDGIFTAINYMPNVNFLFCGLNKDCLNRAFGFMGEIIPRADDIIVLRSTCSICKAPEAATRTIKIKGHVSSIIDIGSDQYQAACPACCDKKNNLKV